MFNLDLFIFNWIYNQCKMLGGLFYLGAFEGAVMWLGIITATVLKVLNNSNSSKVARK